LAKPGLFIVSLEKWAPWNKTNLSHVSMNHCKQTCTMSVLHSVCHQIIYIHTQKTYNQDDLNFQQHTLSFPPGDICNQSHHLQRTSKHKAQKLGNIRACTQWTKDTFISLHFWWFGSTLWSQYGSPDSDWKSATQKNLVTENYCFLLRRNLSMIIHTHTCNTHTTEWRQQKMDVTELHSQQSQHTLTKEGMGKNF
jgi:hypothetical protein